MALYYCVLCGHFVHELEHGCDRSAERHETVIRIDNPCASSTPTVVAGTPTTESED